MKLSEVPLNKKVIIKKIALPQKEKTRLISIGINENKEVVKLYNSFFSTSCIIKSGYIKIALRKDLLKLIEVEYA